MARFPIVKALYCGFWALVYALPFLGVRPLLALWVVTVLILAVTYGAPVLLIVFGALVQPLRYTVPVSALGAMLTTVVLIQTGPHFGDSPALESAVTLDPSAILLGTLLLTPLYLALVFSGNILGLYFHKSIARRNGEPSSDTNILS